MNIGEVFSELSAGKLLTRATWAPDEFIYLVPGSTFTVARAPLLAILGAGTLVTYRPHTDRRYADGTCGYWAPTKEDAEAHDWKEYVEPVVVAAPVVTPVADSPVVELTAVKPAAPAPVAPSVESEPAQAPVAVAPEPAAPVNVIAPVAEPVVAPSITIPAHSNVRIVWYVQQAPHTPVFTPSFWNDVSKAWVGEASEATPYDTMQQALPVAQGLNVPARVVHYARVG